MHYPTSHGRRIAAAQSVKLSNKEAADSHKEELEKLRSQVSGLEAKNRQLMAEVKQKVNESKSQDDFNSELQTQCQKAERKSAVLEARLSTMQEALREESAKAAKGQLKPSKP